jgi:hypothetical protein
VNGLGSRAFRGFARSHFVGTTCELISQRAAMVYWRHFLCVQMNLAGPGLKREVGEGIFGCATGGIQGMRPGDHSRRRVNSGMSILSVAERL